MRGNLIHLKFLNNSKTRTRKFRCGEQVLVTWCRSKHFNKYAYILKIGNKKITVRFMDGTKGFVFKNHAQLIDSDTDDCCSIDTYISVYDSEGRYKVDEDDMPI